MDAKGSRVLPLLVSLMIGGLIFAGQSFAKIDLKDCVGIWLLDEGSGDTFKDSSGNGNNGKNNGQEH